MMLTLCPACATTFRVTAEQLKVKNGKVRCGQCQHVFNALDTLLDAPPEEQAAQYAPESSAAHPVAEMVDDGNETIDTLTDTVSGETVQPPDEPSGTPAPSANSMPKAGAESEEPDITYTYEEIGVAAPAADDDTVDTAAEPPPSPEPPIEESAPLAPSSAVPSGETVAAIDRQPPEIEPLLHEENPPEQQEQEHGGWWAMAAAFALAFLLFQTVLQFRVELSVLWPDSKPALQEICALLGYDLPLPRKISLLSIEASELHPHPQNKGVLTLSATLKNRAPFAQTYPHLELTLTDVADQPILRKILAPADYLPKATDGSTGFAAGSDTAFDRVLIPEAAINAAAAGYRLYLFYP